jgi:predicted nuclease of predicted toxin-antitoxin system
VLTHDLDFGAILAATGADSPSVIQLRIQDIALAAAKKVVLDVVARFAEEIRQGVLISVDEDRARIRILPI